MAKYKVRCIQGLKHKQFRRSGMCFGETDTIVESEKFRRGDDDVNNYLWQRICNEKMLVVVPVFDNKLESDETKRRVGRPKK